MREDDIAYFSRRAVEEEARAQNADDEASAAIHHEFALAYHERVAALKTQADQPRVAA